MHFLKFEMLFLNVDILMPQFLASTLSHTGACKESFELSSSLQMNL